MRNDPPVSGVRRSIEHMFEGFVDETSSVREAGVVPGPVLAEHLLSEELLAPRPDPADHSPAGQAAWETVTAASLDRADGWARLTAWTQAQEMLGIEALVSRTVERAERRPPGTLLDDHVGSVTAEVDSLVAELALTWQVAQRTAARRVDEAVSLVSGLPLAIEAMLDGRLGLAHVRSLGGVLLDLDPALRERLCRELLAPTQDGRKIARTPAQLAGAARRAAVRHDPDSARRRERAAARERGVHLGAEDHGMATVTAYLPAAEALLLYRTIDAHARRVAPADPAPDDGSEPADRSPDARRADSLVDLVGLGALLAAGAGAAPPDTGPDAGPEPPCTCSSTSAAPQAETDDEDHDGAREAPTEAPTADPAPEATEPATPTRAPRSVQVRVLVSADTLLGLDEHPAELVGYGPITAAAARRLAADGDATWRRVLTDPRSGTVLDVGHRRYRPPESMAEHVRNRDLTCTFPGCRVPAQACDLDHLAPWDPHDPRGRTAADNLAPDCRHHHVIKHLPGWAVERGVDGSVLWTTPSRRRYRTIRPVLMPATPDTMRRPPPRAPDGSDTDDLRVLLEEQLRRPAPTAPTRGHDDDAPF